MKTRIVLSAVVGLSFTAGLSMDFHPMHYAETGKITSQADARIGRPATPGSVAGVARRTTRRTIRRSSIYYASLPHGCVKVVIDGVQIWQCGTTYYQAYNNQYVVVYID